MLPVAVLPIAGLLLGLGSAGFSWLPASLSLVMAKSGGAIFGGLPLIFAVGTAIGLCKNDGVAALSAVVGYLVLISALGVFATLGGDATKAVMGVPSLDTGIFGGLWVGLLAAILFNRYHRLDLPPYLGFFAGKRSVPILTAFAAIVSAAILSRIWPPIGSAIQSFSVWASHENPALAFGVYGFFERLLIPFGLHHIWNVPFFFESGEFVSPQTGETLRGEIARFIGGDPSAGNLAGGYLFKMFGLPAAALAIWLRSRPENRKAVGGVMLSAALTSFVTGITEPIEFSFMFVAPLLYGVHAVLSGLSYSLCVVLELKHGMTFSHGLVDFLVLYGKSSGALGLALLGLVWSVLYFFLFWWGISLLRAKTPGREVSAEGATEAEGSDLALNVIHALGGRANIANLDACVTRLRVAVVEPSRVDAEALKALGAAGVLQVADGVQVIFGPRSEIIKTEMEDIMGGRGDTVPSTLQPGKVSSVGSRLSEDPELHSVLSKRWKVSPDRFKVECLNASRWRVTAYQPIPSAADLPSNLHLVVLPGRLDCFHLIASPGAVNVR